MSAATDEQRMLAAVAIITRALGSRIVDKIEPRAELIRDLGADSLDLIEIQMAIEDLAVDAPDEAFHRGVRVSDIAALLPEGVGA